MQTLGPYYKQGSFLRNQTLDRLTAKYCFNNIVSKLEPYILFSRRFFKLLLLIYILCNFVYEWFDNNDKFDFENKFNVKNDFYNKIYH